MQHSRLLTFRQMVSVVAGKYDDGVVSQGRIILHVVQHPTELGVHEGNGGGVPSPQLLDLNKYFNQKGAALAIGCSNDQ